MVDETPIELRGWESRLPLFFRGVGTQGFESKEQCVEVAEKIVAGLGICVRDHDYDLRALDGVTVAFAYKEALLVFDRGFIANGSLTPTATANAEGVAMTVPVVRDGQIRFHIFLHGGLGANLLSEETSRFALALWLLAHEAGHVNHDSRLHELMPGAYEQIAAPAGQRSDILASVFAGWSEYAASRACALLYPAALGMLETNSCNGVEEAAEGTTRALSEHMRSPTNLAGLFSAMVGVVAVPMKGIANFLGHLDALDIQAEDGYQARVTELLSRRPGLEVLVAALRAELRKLWESESIWESTAVFDDLYEIFQKILEEHGLGFYPVEDSFRIFLELQDWQRAMLAVE